MPCAHAAGKRRSSELLELGCDTTNSADVDAAERLRACLKLVCRFTGLDGGAGHAGAEPAASVNSIIRATREQKRAEIHERALNLDSR